MRGHVAKKGRRYYIVYQLNKKPKWEKVPEPNTRRHAEKLLAQRVNEINRGEYREIKKATFSEFSDRWLSDYVDDPNHIKPSSAKQYRMAFRVHLKPYFGNYPLTNITPDLIQGFISKLGKQGMAPQTIKNYLDPLGTMFKHAVRWGFLRSSPMPFVDKPKIPQKDVAFLSAEEVRRFIEHVPERWYSFFLTAVMTGMRLGELLAMRWGNLDLENGQYHVRERLYDGQFDVPKSRTSMRAVDLTPTVVAALKAHRVHQSQAKLAQGAAYKDTDLIFCLDGGTPVHNQKDLREALRRAIQEAGCPPIRFHSLRHSYASLLIAQGENPKYTQNQLGHASITMTFDLYGHLMPEAHTEAVRRLDAQVFGTG